MGKEEENIHCRDPENFCFMCCDIQFRDYDQEREQCEDSCDEVMLKQENNGRVNDDNNYTLKGHKNESCDGKSDMQKNEKAKKEKEILTKNLNLRK